MASPNYSSEHVSLPIQDLASRPVSVNPNIKPHGILTKPSHALKEDPSLNGSTRGSLGTTGSIKAHDYAPLSIQMTRIRSDGLSGGTERIINPDLPTRDAVYVFVGFTSYAKTPKQGARGVGEEGLRHAGKLLEYVRELQTKPKNRIHVLHVKYRFPKQPGEKTTGETVHPFSVMLDPVLKIDMKPTGTFEPSFASAVFRHMAEQIKPPPKNLVISYVAADVTATHVKDLSVWASNTTPPITMFSVTETRLREPRAPQEFLGEAIDISMYMNEGESPLYDPEALASAFSVHAYQHFGRSTSGGSYLRAKEKALRQFGVITNSFSSARGSWRSETSGGVGGVRVMRGATLEALIDSMGLGEGVKIVTEDQQDKQPSETPKSSSIEKLRGGLSGSKKSWTQVGLGAGHGKYSNTTWRDLVLAENDRFNPEYVDPDSERW